MLITDGSPNATEDLRAYESAILSVANTEYIDLGVKLQLTTEEISQDVLDFLLNRAVGNDYFSSGAAVSDPRGNTRRLAGVSDVVVTRQLKRWHALQTLRNVYRDAFNNQLNDRYEAKFEEYRDLAIDARRLTLQFGIGLVYAPLPVAPYPNFDFVAGTIAATTYYVRAAWVTATGQEGAPSDATSYDAPAGSLPVITLNSPPANATGFNVYMGATPDSLSLQNPAPIAIGTAFTLPSSGLVPGRPPGNGQIPDLYLTNAPMLRRG